LKYAVLTLRFHRSASLFCIARVVLIP
jgi:hypothetical protein